MRMVMGTPTAVGHSYAMAALKAGINPKIVSHRLGHASVAFTLSVHAHTL